MKINDVFEARVPGLDYEEKVKNKKTDPTIDRVILTLKSKDSEIMTKMAMRYKELDNLSKEIKEERDNMNEVVKTKMTELFDAEDIWRTRVIETVSATMTLAKGGEATPASVQVKVDYEKVTLELMALLEGELLAKGKTLLNTYTSIERIPEQPAKSPALRVEPKESVNEAMNWDKLKAWSQKFLNAFKNWGKSYDQKLKALEDQMSPMQESEMDEASNLALKPGDRVKSIKQGHAGKVHSVEHQLGGSPLVFYRTDSGKFTGEPAAHLVKESTPFPTADALKAGYPDIKVGDKIRTRKMSMIGTVEKIVPEKAWNTDAIFFRAENGKLMRTPLSNVTKLHVSNEPAGYAERVKELEDEGLTTSDAQGVADAEFKMNEDFGSSDWSAITKSMDQELKSKEFSPEALESAARRVAEHYHEMIGHEDMEDTISSIIRMYMVRKGFYTLLKNCGLVK